MEVQILFNSAAVEDGFCTGWGLSFLVGGQVLFDTGENGAALMENIKRLDAPLSRVKGVVISHDHWDHTGGLWELLKHLSSRNVYGCPGFSEDFKENVKKAKAYLFDDAGPKKISENIYTSGEIKGLYKDQIISEQAMIIESDKGLTVLSGCAHPGILEIIRNVVKMFNDKKIYAVLGGFHLMNKHPRNVDGLVKKFKGLGIEKVGATHCCGAEAEECFRKVYKENFLSLNVGARFDV